MLSSAWIKKLKKSLTKQTTWWLVLLLLFAFITRSFRVYYPERYYFDEVYHAVTAKLIVRNDPRAYEWWNPAPEPNTAVDWLHPPLAKLTQAASMQVLGANSFGWRFSSVLFGTGVVLLTYKLANTIGFNRSTSLLAAALASLDGLLLTMSRIAMNDIHVTFFMLLSWWLYWRWRQQPHYKKAVLVGLSAGAAIASKWSGIFVLGPIVVDLLLSPWVEKLSISKNKQHRHWGSNGLLLLVWLVTLMPIVYLLSYTQMFTQNHGWSHLRELHQQIWWYQTNLEATHPYQSTPWQWILNWRPVYAFVQSDGKATQQIYLQGNTMLFWSGAAAVLTSVLLFAKSGLDIAQDAAALVQAKSAKQIKKIQQRLQEKTKELTDFWPLWWLVAAYFSVWIVWVGSPRIMFFYHYTPAVPILCIILAYWLQKLINNKDQSLWAWLLIGLIALNFIVFFPHWTALPVSSPWLEKIYFALPSWR